MIRLPSWKPQKPSITRPTAEKVNQMQPNKQTITVAGYGDIIPVVYGESEVAGPVIAGPVVRGDSLYYAVALSHGPIESIVEAYVGDDKYPVTSPFSGTKVFAKTGYSYRCTFYQGTSTQAPSSILATRIAGFADAFKDVAYVVVQASGADAVYGGAHFKIKGRRVLDPRDNVISYTENAALHMYDFVTNSYFGLGRGMQGINDLAEENDRILAYGPKVRVGHAIQKAGEESSILELLAMYAEALFGFRGGDVYVVPDALIPEEDITDIPYTQIREGSIRLSSRSSRNIPSSVTITYNTKTVDGLAGPSAYVSVAETNASDPYMNSSLVLMGVYRAGEAERRAGQRLTQLRTPGRVSFQMFDSGLYFNAGDVVRLPNIMGLGGETFRLIGSPEMIAEGIYQMSCEVYNEVAYASEVFGTQSIPKGAVLFRSDTIIPQGFSRLNKMGFVAGGLVAADGGADDVTIPADDFLISPSGGHKATTTVTVPISTIQGVRFERIEPVETDRGLHDHKISREITLGSSQFDRTGLAAVVANDLTFRMPVGSIFFTEDSFSAPWAGKIIASGLLYLANSIEIKSEDLLKGIKTSSDGGHHHYKGIAVTNRWGMSEYRRGAHGHTPVFGGDRGGHDHTLDFDLRVDKPKRVKLFPSISSTTDGLIPVGGIIGSINTGPLDPGWALCDGSNGTVNLVDAFIGFTDSGDGPSEPSVSLSGVSLVESGAHNHKSGSYFNYRRDYLNPGPITILADHPDSHGLHDHPVSVNGLPVTVTPRYTKIRFIQYIGE